MAIICDVDFATAKTYDGLNLKTKWEGKNQQVFLRLLCNETNIREAVALARGSRNILMVDYQCSELTPVLTDITPEFVGSVYVGRVVEFGNNFSEQDLQTVVDRLPTGVYTVVKLTKDYNDMENLYNLSKKFSRVRFCGGTLFAIDGVKVGAIGVDILNSRNIKFNVDAYYLEGTVDVLPVVDIDLLEIDTTGKSKARSSSSNKSTKKSSGTKSKPKKSIASMWANLAGTP